MKPYLLLDTATEHDTTMKLYQRGDEFSIRVEKAGELMNSRTHNSEDILAELACNKISDRNNAQLLVGGLGIGFTLATALTHSAPSATVTVSELMSAVVRWNRQYMGAVANYPLNDKRVVIIEQDVGKVMREHKQHFDAIMLDVDNGPDSFSRDDNNSLYGLRGLHNAYNALTDGGVLTVWSAFSDHTFTQRLKKVGFSVEAHKVKAHKSQRRGSHTIWLAVRA